MHIDSLNTLKQVVSSGSFSDAAEVLGLTQPAVSKRIAKLEEFYDCLLLERSGKRIKASYAGELLIAAIDDINQQLNHVRQLISTSKNEVSGSLNIIISHHIGIHRLPPTLKKFYDLYPGVRLNISFADSELAYNRTAAGEADFGIVTLAPKPHPKLRDECIWPDPLIFMAGAIHPFANQQVTLKQLSQTEAVLPGFETYTGQIVKRLFNQQGLPLIANMATNYLETIKMMASVGLGWTMLPESMLDDSMARIRVEGVDVERQLGLIQRISYEPSAAAKAFFQLLRNSA